MCMERFVRVLAGVQLAVLVVWLGGCGGGGSAQSETDGTSGAADAGAPVTAEPAPAAFDVPAELGGEGFTGDGWETVEPYPLGDPRAVRGGAISTAIREFPSNIRMAGTGHNTWLNYTIAGLCYQSLLTLDPNTLEFIPQLATHWKVSKDQMTFQYRIDPSARWSDGRPVVAEDVVATWKLLMDPSLQDPSAQLVFGKFNEPVAKSHYIVEVTAKERNWRNFLYFSTMTVLPAHEIGQIKGSEYLDKYNFRLTAVTGPYMLRESDIDKGNSLILTRRKDFWAEYQPWYRGLYNFEKIRFVVVRDPQVTYEKVIKGELDYWRIPKAEWWAKTLPEVPAVKNGWLVRQKIYNQAPNGIAGFAINMRNAPLDDVRVRKALQYLYDRETLIAKLAYNEYLPIDSYYPGSIYASPLNEPIRYDPGKAVALLEEAGWKEVGTDGVRIRNGKRLSLKLSYYSELSEKYLTSFKESCAEVGVEILLDRTNPETLWKNLMERKFQMASIAWGALVFPNPETSFHSRLADQNDNNNITGFKDPRVDELCAQYDLAFDQQERVRIIREIDHIVYNTHPYVLEWYLPCQRVMYWNRFGMPEYGFHRTSEWEDAFVSWWVDPARQKALHAARKTGTPLPIPPLELHYWDEQDGKQAAASVGTSQASARTTDTAGEASP